MASRKTLAEAQELSNEIGELYPDATIVIEESYGWFYVNERRTCDICGKTYSTAAIGEYSGRELLSGKLHCQECDERACNQARQDCDQGIREARRRQDYAEFHDTVLNG